MAGRIIGTYLRLSASPLSGSANVGRVVASIMRRDVEDGGAGSIYGTVTILGVPAKRRVRLMHRRSARIIRQTWSDPITGAYRFDFLKTGEAQAYMPVADDYEAIWNAVVADRATADAE